MKNMKPFIIQFIATFLFSFFINSSTKIDFDAGLATMQLYKYAIAHFLALFAISGGVLVVFKAKEKSVVTPEQSGEDYINVELTSPCEMKITRQDDHNVVATDNTVLHFTSEMRLNTQQNVNSGLVHLTSGSIQ